jgi:hypothetical protein
MARLTTNDLNLWVAHARTVVEFSHSFFDVSVLWWKRTRINAGPERALVKIYSAEWITYRDLVVGAVRLRVDEELRKGTAS